MSDEEYKAALENRILKNLDLTIDMCIPPTIRLAARLQVKRDWKELYNEDIGYDFFEKLAK